VDVLFVKQAGRFTGEAFAVLPSAAHVDVAISKNKSYLGRRYVEVFRASKLVGGLALGGAACTLRRPCAPRRRAIPAAPGCSAGAPPRRRRLRSPCLRPCLLPLPPSAQDYYKAVMHEMSSGYPLLARQMQQQGAGPRRRHGLLTAPGYAPEGVPTTVIKLRGLPWSVRKHDLIAWFSDLPIQPPNPEK
jgi:hypothetical protein